MASEDMRALYEGTGFIPHPAIAHHDQFGIQQQARMGALERIMRWGKIESMTHRTSDGEHSLRVPGLVILTSSMLLEVGVDHSQLDAIVLAENHDTTEIDTGDMPTPDKRNATPEEKAKIDQDELDAATNLEWMVQMPKGADTFRKRIEQYRKQETMVDRMVKYWDAFDGQQEAVNEVVCGENPERFRQALRENEPLYREQYEQNQDWISSVKLFLGDEFFDIPNPNLIPQGRTPEEADYSSVASFIDYISAGAPRGYKFWLKTNQFVFRHDFLQRTFSGWQGRWPESLIKDFQEVKAGNPFRTTQSGLLVPRSMSNPTFAEDVLESQELENISMHGAVLRQAFGLPQSPPECYFARFGGE